MLSPRIKHQARTSIPTSLTPCSTEVLATSPMQEKINKTYNDGTGGNKMALFSADMTVCRENLKESTQKIL